MTCSQIDGRYRQSVVAVFKQITNQALVRIVEALRGWLSAFFRTHSPPDRLQDNLQTDSLQTIGARMPCFAGVFAMGSADEFGTGNAVYGKP
jgi:hypothetical protein